VLGPLGAFVVLNVVAMTLEASDRWLPPQAGADVASARDATLGRVASALVGAPTEVWCWSRADWRARTDELTRAYYRGQHGRSPYGPWSAFAVVRRREIHLSPEVCAELHRLARERVPLAEAEWPDALAWSVLAFAHEAFHVVGVMDEAAAECYGMQSIARAARLLGRSPAEGRALTLRYRELWRPGLPASYRSKECRSGGLLDLDRNRSSWP
jgi:hypothetical protein